MVYLTWLMAIIGLSALAFVLLTFIGLFMHSVDTVKAAANLSKDSE